MTVQDANLKAELEECRRALLVSETRFQDVFGKLPDAILVVDREGFVKSLNAAAERVLASRASEILGQKFGMSLGHGGEWEVAIPRRDGVKVTAEVHVAETHWDGAPAYVVTLRDITERKREIQHLRDENAKLTLFHTISKVIVSDIIPDDLAETLAWELKTAFSIDAFFIEAVESDTGHSYGLGMFDTIDGEFQMVSPIAHAAKGQPAWRKRLLEERRSILVNRDPANPSSYQELEPFGNTGRRSISLTYIPLMVGERLVGIMSLQSYTPNAYQEKSLDILSELGQLIAPAVERMLLHHSLIKSLTAHRRNTQTMQALLNALTHSAVLLDLDGTYLAVNDSAAKMLGKPATDLVGSSAWQHLPQHIVDMRREKLQHVVKTGQKLQYEDSIDNHRYDHYCLPVYGLQGRVEHVAVFTRQIFDTDSQHTSRG